ncbi:Nuclear transcription factor Y subunit C-2 [Heracleum sosnowskyi]|uniref:Nuclear transcription factor Y subunit C-2 n=1 Tax=Heracleum sosnowskyi TaxID=360622 RepID=A0AAD8N245_9APIA|nr:Nuclear transcription factor Y subunit C-2 [Heracleum sosnowskyi]
MDHSEQAQNQVQRFDDGATQIPAAPGLSYAATPALATSCTLRAPVPLPTLPPPISNSHNLLPRHSAQHFNNLEQRLQSYWEARRQQVEQMTNFNHSVPLARIKKIMQADEDVNMIAAEAPVVFAKAAEMFVMEMTLRGWAHTEEDRRRVLQTKDIAAAISESDLYDFLADVIPKYLSNPTNATIPQPGSSAMTYQYGPNQQYAAGPSGTVMYAGGQQPQLPIKPFIDWGQAFEPWAPQPEQINQQQNDQQLNQESSVTLVPQPHQIQHDNQQNQESSMPLAPQPQQMQPNKQRQDDDSEEF